MTYSIFIYMRYLLLCIFFLTGCYTTVNYQRPNTVTSVLAVTAQGDTVQVPTYQFYTNYQERPSYYTDWRFYWNDMWYNPHNYYTFYNRYPYVWTYTPYKTNYNPPKIDSKPRSSGTTTGRSSEKTKSEPRTTGRTQPQKSDRPKEPQRKKRGGS